MGKPISLNSLTFSDTKGNMIVTEDYFITFKDDDFLEWFIRDKYNYWKNLLKVDLVFSQDSCETMEELDIRKTVRLIAKYFKVDYNGVKSRSRKTEYIEVRRMAIAICVARQTRITTIAKAMNIHHANVIHHRDVFKNLCETDVEYKNKFDDVDDYISTTFKSNGYAQ